MTQLFEQMLSTVRRFLFVSKYVCMLFVLAAFYGACQVNYLDYALSYGGKLVVILAVSWHLGALLYKGFLTYQLGFVNPESKAVFITGKGLPRYMCIYGVLCLIVSLVSIVNEQ